MTASGTQSQTGKETWTTERVDILKSYVEAGLSCAQIAREIGATRNAVIGKIHRLGLSRPRSTVGRAERTGARTRRPGILNLRRILRAAYAEASSRAAEDRVTAAERCSLLDLANGKCRWPINDPGSENFCFCGDPSVGGLSYCVTHARIAYRRPTRRYAQPA
jgi:GcrA cell cycle regulator